MAKSIVIKSLKNGNFVIIDDVPCRVVSVSVTKSGKHGGAKCRLEGMGLFDGRRRSIVKPADTKVFAPVVMKKNAQVLAILGNNAQLMDLTDYSTFELAIPEGMKLNSGEEINYFEVSGVRSLEKLK